MDEKKRIIEFDAAEEVPADGQIPIDSASKGTKKITPALLLKAITDLLGDEALDTLAQTLTGAVNEVKGIADDAQDLAENISDEYSSTSAYAKGDYCIHNNTLYKCTTAIGSGGEAWNASHWSATKCDDELSELKGTLTVKAKEISGTTDAQGRLLSTGFSIANKAVVGVISGGHGQIALQLRLSNNNFAVKFLDSSGMSVIANTSCSCIVYYVDTFEIQT